jgi:hypothetical protein
VTPSCDPGVAQRGGVPDAVVADRVAVGGLHQGRGQAVEPAEQR